MASGDTQLCTLERGITEGEGVLFESQGVVVVAIGPVTQCLVISDHGRITELAPNATYIGVRTFSPVYLMATSPLYTVDVL